MIPASFRDPSGFVFHKDGHLYRQINHHYQTNYKLLIDSGLYQHLAEAHLLIPHEDVGLDLAETGDAFRVIRPERIRFISYPYEWCFSQLKDAALATLRIQKEALRFGMTLKDASAYNIQFHNGRPLLIDTLSFERYEEGQPWTPYRQFCQHFLAPLALMSYKDVRLNQLLRIHIDGIPLDLAAQLMPRRSYLKLSLLLHLFLHARGQRSFTDERPHQQRRLSIEALSNLLDNLITGIESLQWQPAGTDWNWTDYYGGDSYTETSFQHKQQIVEQFIERARPGTVWDLGGNTGIFSRIASDRGIFTVSCDADPGAVEKNYRLMIQKQERSLLPLLIDLTNPSPALGWANEERDSFRQRGQPDLVMSLALIHHLAIGNNVPLQRIARAFASLGHWLIIEFVPRQDRKVQQLLAARDDIFAEYHLAGFEAAFSAYYTIMASQPIADSERVLYLMRVKSNAQTSA